MRLQLALLVLVLAGISSAQDTNFPAGPQYLINTNNSRFLRPIATPSMSLDAPLPGIPSLPQIGPEIADQPYVSTAEPVYAPDLFPIYYGSPEPAVIELTGNPPRELPANINDTGFIATDAPSLREFGYGATIGEAASFWKTHKGRAPRVYTNADVQH